MELCPCGTQKPFAQCCQPLLKGEWAKTPEALMRSRYTAFAIRDLGYVRATTDPQTVFDFDAEATREWAENAEFFKLEILRSTDEGNKGIVEFRAYFKMKGVEEVHHELSKFRKHAGRWYFRDGRLIAPPPPPPSA